jgi:DNA-directed RNA polymerase subunit M/transcription elongation factor TFIIS
MEKIVTCTKCRKTFTVSGPYGRMKEVPHGVTCPFCTESNELMWPMDTGFTTIPKQQAPRKAPNTQANEQAIEELILQQEQRPNSQSGLY